jgi:hypothetical protein
MKKYILIVSVLIAMLGINRLTSGKETVKTANDDGCKCYANGYAYSPGSQSCLGGFKSICVARYGVGEDARDCGWDYVTDSNGNYIRCLQ